MSYTLIITEKPTASKAISEALADGKPKKIGEKYYYYEFIRGKKKFMCVPAVGHLFTLRAKTKNYPVLEAEWIPSYETKQAAFTREYFENMKNLAESARDFIVATDYDTEGEVIAYNILRFICKRNDAKRMKFSTMTVEELKESYEKMLKHMDFGLVEAGLTRHYLDNLWGVSISKALMSAIKQSGRRFTIMSTGRVQGPSLHMLAKHEYKIKAFKPKPFWQLELQIKIGKQLFKAEYEKDKIWSKDEADKILQKAKGKKDAIVKNISKKLFTQKPPIPYNTTAFLADVYRYFGYSPQQGMNIAESLYQAGLISYPRTNSQQLPPDINYKKIISGLSKQDRYAKDAKFLLEEELKPNQGKATSAAHPAIYPTGQMPKKLGDLQQRVYDLVVRRFFAVFGKPAKRESQKISLDVNGEIFFLMGKKTIEAGWTSLYGKYAARDETILPDIKIGDKFSVSKIQQFEKKTQPPPRYSQGSVLKEMEQRGLGTQCVLGDTKIICENNEFKQIDKLFEEGFRMKIENNIEIRRLNTPTILSLNEINKNIQYTKPTCISRRKLEQNEKVFYITTESGSIKITENHPIYIYDSGMKIKLAKELSVNDKIISIIDRNKIGSVLIDKTFFNIDRFKLVNGKYLHRFSSLENSGISESSLPIRWSSNLAWILGYFYGDGSYSSAKYTGSERISFTTTEKKALELLKNRIRTIFGFYPYVYNLRGKFKVDCNGVMSFVLVSVFPQMKSKEPFDIPKEFIGDFLRGFFDADGNVHLRENKDVRIFGSSTKSYNTPRIKFSIHNYELIKWVSVLLDSLKINTTGIHVEKARLNDKEFTRYTIRIGGKYEVDKFAWKIGFDVQYKQNLLYRGLTCESPQYKSLNTGYAVVRILKESHMDISELSERIKNSKYEILKSIKRLLKLGVIKRKKYSPRSACPNRIIYMIVDTDYFKHSIKACSEMINTSIHAVPIKYIKELDIKDEWVYDLSVKPDSPNFVIDGCLLVHNSTRAGILQILYNRGYVIGKSIEVTELGLRLSDILEKNVPDIVSEKLTRHFEEECESVQEGKIKRERVIEEAKEKLIKISNQFRKKEKRVGEELTKAIIEAQEKQSILGECPRCGGTLKVHKFWRTGSRFVGCTGYKKGCDFSAPLPKFGTIIRTEKICEQCKTPIIQVYTPGRRPFRMCVDLKCPTKKEWYDKSKIKGVKPRKEITEKKAKVKQMKESKKKEKIKVEVRR